jgi:hypothetical protein
MATAKQLLGHVWDRITNHREEAKGSKPLYVKLAFCSQSLLNSSYCVLLLTLPEALHSSRGASNLRYPSFQNPRNTPQTTSFCKTAKLLAVQFHIPRLHVHNSPLPQLRISFTNTQENKQRKKTSVGI